jgi:SAM-dependent methyltransferase
MDMGNRAREDRAYKAGVRQAWAGGDYHRFATDLVWHLGAELVAACGIRPSDRVLDVATGSGNVALRAAEAGAAVVASDLAPENFAAGRRVAERAGLAIDWVEADAEGLPFADAGFDVVTSSVGAMWAPDSQRVADELLRVCRPGGTIGLINFAADGLLAGFLGVFARYSPPPPPWASSPLLWGDPDYLRHLFGDRVSTLEITPATYTERVPGGPRGYCQYYKETFGPVAAIYAALTPGQAAGLDRDFLSFATQNNTGPAGGPAELDYQYVRVIAHSAGHQGQANLSGRILLTTRCPDDPRTATRAVVPPARCGTPPIRHPREWVYRRMRRLRPGA